MFSVPTQEEIDREYADKEKKAKEAAVAADKAKKIADDKNFRSVVDEENANQAKLYAELSKKKKKKAVTILSTGEKVETPVVKKEPISKTLDLLHQKMSEAYYKKKKAERDNDAKIQHDNLLKSIEKDTKEKKFVVMNELKEKPKGNPTTPWYVPFNEEVETSPTIETEPPEKGDELLCGDQTLLQTAIKIIYGTDRALIGKPVILQCAIDLGVPDVKADSKLKIAELKKGIIEILNTSCKNIYKNIDKDFFIKTFLSKSKTDRKDLTENLDILNSFFSRPDFSEDCKKILLGLNDPDIQSGLTATQELLSNPINNNNVDVYKNLLQTTKCFEPIIKNIGPLRFTPEVNSKRPFLCLMFFLFYLASLRNIHVEINNNTDTGDINYIEMDEVFKQIPVSLDARQLITVNRFTKFKKQNDKATFLFHGVGTGKTITSTTIALSYLTEINIFNIDGTGNANKKPLEILVMCPQGLFFSAFAGDAPKLGIYVYNKTVYEVERQEIKYTFEKFEACVKIDEQKYYKLKFTGFNYTNLFKIYGIEQVTLAPNEESYDVLICDEAHKIITEQLKPLGKQTYITNYGGSNILEDGKPIVKGSTYYPDVKPTDPFVTAIRDVRFYEFIRSKIRKQAIFLTGTPIQKSMEDIVSITKFLNLKEINASNNIKFCEDVIREAPYANEGFFNFLDGEKTDINNNFMKGAVAKLYTFLQGQTGNQVKDVADALGFPLEDIGLRAKPYDRRVTPYNPNALGPIAAAAARKKAREEHDARMKPINQEKKDRETYENVYKRGLESKLDLDMFSASKGVPVGLMKMNGGTNKLTKYVSNISETSLSLKSVISDIMVNSESDVIINTKPVLDAIVIDSGVSEDSIFQTINYLCRCLNGDFPYEESEKILNSENARKILEPLFGQYNIHENTFTPIYSDINKNGGKKNKKTVKKNIIYKNTKTSKKRNVFKNNTKIGGVLEIMDKEQLEMINKNMNNEILVKELPVLLTIQAINLELSLSPLSDYYTDKLANSIMLNDNTQNPYTNILGFELVIQPYLMSELLKWNHNNNNSTRFEEVKEGGSKQTEMLKLYMKQAVIDIFENLKHQRQGGGFTLTSLSILSLNICKAMVVKLFNLSGNVIVNIPEIVEKTIKIFAKSMASLTESIIATVIDSYNLDGMISNLLPFISIYNYDYISTAINTEKFYEDLAANNFNLSTPTNDNGTTFAFPKKYIENIYYPYSVKQTKEINTDLDNGFSIKKAFKLTNIDFSNDINAKITYIVNEKLNNISCGLGSSTSKEIEKESAFEQMFHPYDADYFDKYENQKAVLKNKYMEYSTNFLNVLSLTYGKDMYNTGYSLGGFYCTMDTNGIIKSKLPEWKHLKKLTRTPINITKTFTGPDNIVDIEQPKDELAEIDAAIESASSNNNWIDFGFSFGQGLPDYVMDEREEELKELMLKRETIIQKKQEELEKNDIESWTTVYDNLKTEIDKNTKDLYKNVKFLNGTKYIDEEETKFFNTLELLKIIRTGKLIHNGEFVYHPHYIKSITNSIEYYLPVVYPPTTEIMYGFCKFLDKQNYKYIWLNNQLGPIDLEKTLIYAQILTFQTREFTVDQKTVNDPICILISPNHKEGFSFTFNPALISLGLSDTAGDEEQIYGRVLRKYGVDGFYGNYDKKIYQYFSGDNRYTSSLQNLVNLYSLDNTTLFRGMYDKMGFEKIGYEKILFTVDVPEWLARIEDQVRFTIDQTIDDMTSSDIFVTDKTAATAARMYVGQSDWEKLTPKLQGELADELMKKYFTNGFLNQDPQLSLLYQVKTKSLDFFSRIAKMEHAKLTRTWGKWFSQTLDSILVPRDIRWITGEEEPNYESETLVFTPLDIEEMRKTSAEPKVYCIENIKNPLYIENNGRKTLNISNAIFCLNKGIPASGGGNKKHKVTKKKNKYNKNKKTRKDKNTN